MKAMIVLWLSLAVLAGPVGAAPLAATFPDSLLRAFAVGRPTTVSAAEQLGFEVAEALSADKSDGKHDVIRLEHFTPRRVYFIELSVKDRIVRAAGWTAEVPADSAEAWSRTLLAEFARTHGFPDDLIAERDVRAVAWADSAGGLRLELVRQNAEDGGGQEISAVLRRF